METQTWKQDAVYQTVKKWIVRGNYHVGARLPSVMELCCLMQYNNRTIAAGLKKLEEEGIIDIIPRKGAVVKSIPLPSRNRNILIFANLSGEFYQDMAPLLTKRFLERDYCPVFANDNLSTDFAENDKFLKNFIEHQTAAGFIVEGSTSIPYELIQQNPEHFQNLVFINRYHHSEKMKFCKYALIDLEASGRVAAEYFAKKGVKRILYPAIPELTFKGTWSSIQTGLMKALKKAAEKIGIVLDERLFWLTFNGASLKEMIQSAFRQNEQPDGIFCYSDYIMVQKILPILKPLGKENLPKLGTYNTSFAKKYGFASLDFQEKMLASAAADLLLGVRKKREILIPPVLAEYDKKNNHHAKQTKSR